MSRSRKKPWYKDSNPYMQKLSNRKVRQYKGDLSNGMSYKNLVSRWDVCDWRFYCPSDPRAYRK